MGIFDALGSSVPGSNVSKPLMIALGALLVSKAMGAEGLGSLFGGQQTTLAPQPGSQPTPQTDGGLLGGTGGLIQRFEQNGLGQIANSWVNPGPNQPVSPQQVHQGARPGDNRSAYSENRDTS